MPAVLAWLAALGPVVVPLARRVLLALGLSVATYTGIGALWTNIQESIWTSLGGASASILTVLGLARVDDGIKVVLSAGSAVLVLRGLNMASGTFRRWNLGAAS